MGNLSLARRDPRAVSRAGGTPVFELAPLLRKCWRHLLVTMKCPVLPVGERSAPMETPGQRLLLAEEQQVQRSCPVCLGTGPASRALRESLVASGQGGGFGAEWKPVRKPGGLPVLVPSLPLPVPAPWAGLTCDQPGLEASAQAGCVPSGGPARLVRDLPDNGKFDSRRKTGISSLEKSDV